MNPEAFVTSHPSPDDLLQPELSPAQLEHIRSEAMPSYTGFGDLSPSRVRDGSPGFLPLTPCVQLILSFFNPGTLIICVIPADLDP